jgi:trypsin
MVSALLTAAALALPLANALPGHPTKEGRLDTREGKIVGGEAAAAGEFPSIVSITNTAVEGLNYCGGTLINDTTVITAGHCSADPASYYRVRAGTLVTFIRIISEVLDGKEGLMSTI